jgi:hypothetical protein
MPQRNSSVWIVGDWQYADFAAVLSWLKTRVRCACFEDAAAAVAAVQSADRSQIPAAILLVQSRPGQLTSSEIERLHATAPLARLIAFVGPWCEGELRSGRPWPGVVRIPWRTWRTALARELALESPSAPLPRTVTDVERMEELTAALKSVDDSRAAAVICTFNHSTYASLADATRHLGYQSSWHAAGPNSPPRASDLIILDGWEQVFSDECFQAIENTTSPLRLLLLHFPRPEDTARAAELGIIAVIAQPLLLNDLEAAIFLRDSTFAGASHPFATL